MTEPDDRPGSDDPEDPSELLRLIGRTVPRSPHATASPQVAPGAEDRAAPEPQGPPAAADEDATTADAELARTAEPADDMDPSADSDGAAADGVVADGVVADRAAADGVAVDRAGAHHTDTGAEPSAGAEPAADAGPAADAEPGAADPARTESAATGATEPHTSEQPEPATATPVAPRPGHRDARSGPAEGGNVHLDGIGDPAVGDAATADTSADHRALRNGARDDAFATLAAQDDRSERPGGRGSGHLDPATEPPGPGTGDTAAAGRTGTTGAAVGPENVAEAENAAEPEGPAGLKARGVEDPRAEDPPAEEPGTEEPGTQDEPEPEEPEFHELADDTELEHALEALLLVVDAPVDEPSLATALHQTPSRIRQTLHRMSLAYTADRRGIDLRRAGEGWRFYTRDRYAPYVEKMLMDGQRARLTRAALETLAVVAYRQPVTRARVSAVRGVNCDGVLRTLLTRGLVEEAGTEEHTGGTLFRTTELFLERLGISSVAELPPLAPLLPDIDAIDDLES
ncbi:SMC-Scp complex subunit ScpB [Pseudonocardia sp. TMWB2A]|uniref:SMC-Scp complex subunit ScpB n=1 Tax=Pseudonocardia sp. TMWB2A TaxID=687430 RepID=UPI003FD1F6E6